jgi:hypothetical protein
LCAVGKSFSRGGQAIKIALGIAERSQEISSFFHRLALNAAR